MYILAKNVPSVPSITLSKEIGNGQDSGILYDWHIPLQHLLPTFIEPSRMRHVIGANTGYNLNLCTSVKIKLYNGTSIE